MYIKTLEDIFWILFIFILITNTGYPIIICALSKLKLFFHNKKNSNAKFNNNVTETKLSNYIPSVLLIISAYNEEKVIEKKIKNSLSLDYENLNIIVACDGCTDKTNEIAESFEHIKIKKFSNRMGKPHIFNNIISKASEEIIIITDANTILHKDSIKNLVKNFENEFIGVVCGNLILTHEKNYSSMTIGEITYWNMEILMKKAESSFGMLVGISGAILAFRKNYYSKIPENIILDDLILSLEIAKKNYSIIFEPTALAFEDTSNSTEDEMNRKTRIISGGLQSIPLFKELLNPFKHKFFYSLIFHKILRWLTPLLTIILLLINFYLSFFLNLYFYISSIIGIIIITILTEILFNLIKQTITGKKDIKVKFTAIPFYFIIILLSGICAIFKSLSGNQKNKWKKAER